MCVLVACRGPARLIQGVRSGDGVGEDKDTLASSRVAGSGKRENLTYKRVSHFLLLWFFSFLMMSSILIFHL